MANPVMTAKTVIEDPATGIEGRKNLADNVSGLLADSTILFVKTQAVHWNVVGPLFYGMHNLTEEQYRDLFEAIDVIAERIRALGHPAPCSVAEMIPLSVIQEFDGPATAEEMLETLASDHEKISKRLRDIVALAEDQRDAATADLLTGRLHFHEKAVWMLRAILTR